MAPIQLSKRKLPSFKRPTVNSVKSPGEAPRVIEQTDVSPARRYSAKSVVETSKTDNTPKSRTHHDTNVSPSSSARFRCVGDFRPVRDIADGKQIMRSGKYDDRLELSRDVNSMSELQKKCGTTSAHKISEESASSAVSSRQALDKILRTSHHSAGRSAGLRESTEQGLNTFEEIRDVGAILDDGTGGNKEGFLKRVARSKSKPLSAEFIIDSDDSNAEAPYTIPAARDTQPVSKSKPTSKKAQSRSEKASESSEIVKSAYFAMSDGLPPPKSESRSQVAASVPLDLDLEPALRRSRSWTPPVTTTELDLEAQLLRSDGTHLPHAAPFAALVENFAYSADMTTHIHVGDVGQKRQKLSVRPEPVAKTKALKPPPPPRQPKQKKKPQTITALATAAYLPAQVQTEHQTTLHDVVEKTAVVVAARDAHADATNKVKRKVVRKPAAESKSSKKKSIGKVDIRHSPLATPSQAQQTFSKQTFVFGTSSQIRGDESPETIAQIQLALHESEFGPPRSSFAEELEQSFVSVPTAPHGTALTSGQSSRNLWSVSARDFDGGYLHKESQASRNDSVHDIDAEVLSVQECPEQEHDHDIMINTEATTSASTTIAPSLQKDRLQGEDPFAFDQDVVAQSPEFVMISSDSIVPDEAVQSIVHISAADRLPVSPYGNSATNGSTNIVRRSVLQPLDANLDPTRLSRRPGYRTTRSISSQSSSQDVDVAITDENKPRRGRPKKVPMTSPIQKAPKRNVIAARSEPKHINSSPSKVFAVSQQSTETSWHNIDEISDSESPASSPPNLVLSEDDAGPDSVDAELPIVEDVEIEVEALRAMQQLKETDSQWSSILASLYPRITTTIKALPPSDSLTNPSWHEKILLYDPIVIEDLTTWLNEAGLHIVVKRKSKTKAKKSDSNVDYEEVQEPLSPWMVQKWCEQNSICCLWKEGLRGGVRTKY